MSRSNHPRHPMNYSRGRWYGNSRALMSQQSPSLGTAARKRSAFRSHQQNNSGWRECFGPAAYSRSTWRLRIAADDAGEA